ncbi:MAG: hypothetical protein KIS78_04550 [Labilithrix sp.]|nr:hypothetical protein [Labilithrix sp.]MCW5831709.1 hypothetical protein [Labilithrix sp.]
MNGTARLPLFARGFALVAALFTPSCGGAEGPPPSTPAAAPPAEEEPRPPVDGNLAMPAPSASAALSATHAGDGAWPFVGALSDGDRDAQLERLKKDPGPIKSNWVPPGKSDRYGHAEGIIEAPTHAVRAKLLDFTRYKDLAGPKFKNVRVVDKQGQNTDVYFQLPIMRGLVTIWYVTRFQPSRATGGGDVLEGTFVKGNIKSMHIAFTVRPGTEETNSVLVCDLVLRPNVPAPQSALDEELRDACGDAINSLRKTIAANP